MKTKHTPGPWRYYPAAGRRWTLVMARRKIIANVYTSRTLPADANARLIAAAPGLLDACKVVVDTLAPAPVLETDWNLPGMYQAWKLCVNAIAKAEGQ